MTNGVAISAATGRDIDERLDEIEREHAVRNLLAVESGSRARGFLSPDSDFDVRFVYVHAPDWYLSIDARRDVIELPIVGDLDISGWDLKKALQLLVKPNPVLLEWLRSPVVYRADAGAMARLAALGARTAHLRPSMHHYLHLGESQYRRFLSGGDRVPIKKYFYAHRPVLALMWLRVHPERPVPMTLSALREGLDLQKDISVFPDDLVARKATTKEPGLAPRIAALDALIEVELDRAREAAGRPSPVPPDLLDAANAAFRDIVHRRT